jgi:hypothetical protein
VAVIYDTQPKMQWVNNLLWSEQLSSIGETPIKFRRGQSELGPGAPHDYYVVFKFKRRHYQGGSKQVQKCARNSQNNLQSTNIPSKIRIVKL